MKPSFDVIVCGSLHLDIVVNAKALPRIDETAIGSKWKKVCGGKGGNQAVQAARAGARTAMIGRIGDDEFGQTLQANLIGEGVDVTCLTVDAEAGSGMSVAIVQEDGNYGAVIVSGSNLLIDDRALQEQWAKLGGGAVVVLQNEAPQAVNLAMAKVARSAGASVVLNAAPARPLANEFLELVDVLIVNRVEAEAMTGIAVTDSQAARAAISKLTSVSRAVIVTLGGEGLLIAPAVGETVEIAAVPVRVASTHGAGDCFVGTLSARLADGTPLVEAAHMANAAAAAFVTRSS